MMLKTDGLRSEESKAAIEKSSSAPLSKSKALSPLLSDAKNEELVLAISIT